jgi:hypothetical protein
MAETFASTLNQSFDPVSAVTSLTRGGTAEQRGAFARKSYPEIFQAESAAKEDVMRSEAEAKKAQIDEEYNITKQFGGKEREAVEKYQAGLQPAPEPQITKFDAGAAAELAVQTALLGALTGFVGAESSLGAIEGFTRGHKQGREDLYKQQVQDFERKYKTWKDNNTLARQILDDSLKLLSTDKTAAMVNLKKLDPLLQNGLILAQTRLGRVVDARKLADTALQIENKIDSAIETAIGKPQKIDSKVRTAIREGSILVDRLEQLKSTAKPQYFQLSGGLPSDKLAQFRLYLQETSEGTTVGDLANILGLSVDNAAVQWWKDYADLIADVRKERFGATLTGNEKQSFRQTVIEPSSSYQSGLGVLDRQLKAAERSYNRYLSEVQRSPTQQAQTQTAPSDVQAELTKRNLPYEPQIYNYGFDEKGFYRERKGG